MTLTNNNNKTSVYDMDAFEYSFDLLNLLNGQTDGNCNLKLPSTTNFTWSKEMLKKSTEFLKEIGTAIQFNWNLDGLITDEFQRLEKMDKDIEEFCKGKSLKELTDHFYNGLYYFSDKWNNERYWKTVSFFEQIESAVHIELNI